MKKNLFILLLWYGVLSAQQPVSIKLTQRDGLPDVQFYDMLEDNQGFMWFACDKGLYRYDGREFKHYSSSLKRGLSAFNLQLDAKNRLWCTNITGQFFYVESDSLRLNFDMHKDVNQRQALYNFTFLNNHLVVLGFNILVVKNINTNKISILEERKPKGKSFRYLTSEKKKDTLFLMRTSKNTVVKSLIYKDDKLILKTYAEKDLSPKIGSDIRTFLYKYQEDVYFQQKQPVYTAVRGLVFANKLTLLKDLPLTEYKKINYYTSLDDKLWMLTEKGAEVFKQDSTSHNLVKTNHYFPNRNITEVVKDKEQNYWFSTLRNGIYVVPNINLSTYKLKQDIGNISTITKINDTHIYFGTTLGWVGIYDINAKKTNYIKLKANSKVRHIIYNKKLNDVYVSLDQIKGSFIIDATTHKVIQTGEKRSFEGVKGIVLLNNGKLFVAAVGFHSILTMSKGNIKEINHLDLTRKRNYSTYYDKKNETIYIAYVDDLIVYDKNLKPKRITLNNQSILVRSITQTNDGIIWVSTLNNGVLAIKNDMVIKRFMTKDGLLSNQTTYLKSDEKNIWIVTNKGIQLLETKTNTFKNLLQKDGIESFNVNSIEIIGNTVWYGSNLGLFSFDKTKVFKPTEVIKPYFTSVAIADSIYPLQKQYTVPFNKKRIAISFNSNAFQSAQNTTYEYRLKEQTKKWQPITKGGSEVVLNELPQGKYTFQLRTSNQEKKSVIKEIAFNVKGIFYEQWWFILLLFLVLIFYISYQFKKRLQEQKKKQQIIVEKKQNELEKTFLKLENLRSQMNPHFVFNALNSIQDYIIHNQKDLAGDYLGKFADLIRSYLEQSSKKHILLFEEIDTLERYLELEKLRFEDTLEYNLIVESAINTEAVFIPTMLIQPYIENSLKHGLLHKKGKGNLTVIFKQNEEKNLLTCIITDDGVGREKSKQIQQNRLVKHKSFATKATQDRLQLLNYRKNRKITITIEDLIQPELNENCGTKVTINIPV